MSIAMDLKCHLPPRQNSNQDRSLHKLAVRLVLLSALPIQQGCLTLPIWSKESMAQDGH
jgi:hypothetical protein